MVASVREEIYTVGLHNEAIENVGFGAQVFGKIHVDAAHSHENEMALRYGREHVFVFRLTWPR